MRRWQKSEEGVDAVLTPTADRWNANSAGLVWRYQYQSMRKNPPRVSLGQGCRKLSGRCMAAGETPATIGSVGFQERILEREFSIKSHRSLIQEPYSVYSGTGLSNGRL